jgi:hypothetical protein
MLHIMPKSTKPLFFAVLSMFLILSSAAHLKAASPTTGVTVAPAFVTIDLDGKDEEQLAYVGVKNNYSTSINLKTELKGIDQERGIIAPIKELSSNLSQLISIAPSEFTLDPGESINIQVRVKNGSILGPGGSYAALVIKQAGSQNNVGLQSAISVNIFITKEKGAIRKIELIDLKLSRFLFSSASKATVVFRNSGNVIATPRGVLTISGNSLNTIYKKGVVNEGSQSVFPLKQLTLDTSLTKVNNRWLPGRQKVTLQYRVEGQDALKTYEAKIMYIPNFYWLILAILLVAARFTYNYRKNTRKKHYKLVVKKAKNEPKTASKSVPKKSVKKIIVSDDTQEQKISPNKGE